MHARRDAPEVEVDESPHQQQELSEIDAAVLVETCWARGLSPLPLRDLGSRGASLGEYPSVRFRLTLWATWRRVFLRRCFLGIFIVVMTTISSKSIIVQKVILV